MVRSTARATEVPELFQDPAVAMEAALSATVIECMLLPRKRLLRKRD